MSSLLIITKSIVDSNEKWDDSTYIVFVHALWFHSLTYVVKDYYVYLRMLYIYFKVKKMCTWRYILGWIQGCLPTCGRRCPLMEGLLLYLIRKCCTRKLCKSKEAIFPLAQAEELLEEPIVALCQFLHNCLQDNGSRCYPSTLFSLDPTVLWQLNEKSVHIQSIFVIVPLGTILNNTSQKIWVRFCYPWKIFWHK